MNRESIAKKLEESQFGVPLSSDEIFLVVAALRERAKLPTEKELRDAGWVRRGGPVLVYQGGDNIVPTAVEYYNPETGHAVVEYVGIQSLLLEKGKESQYEKRYLYWAGTRERKS